jgi:thiamine-phosphate pyrophosphorylase
MKLPYMGYLQAPAGSVKLYYITDRRRFPGGPEEQKRQLLQKIAECAAAGVDYIQLREKDLSIRALEDLAVAAVKSLPAQTPSRLLINSCTDVALACGAHGVHLPASDLPASEVRAILSRAGNVNPVIAVSVHSLDELSYAEAHGANFTVFGPIFEKEGAKVKDGLLKLRQACHRSNAAAPVIALGGITLENAPLCLAAGAHGIAAISMFQENDAGRIMRRLRNG